MALVCALAGCSSGDSDGAGEKEQFISELCAEYAGCCEAAGRPSDGAQCRAFYGAFVSASSYDATAAQACLEEVRARQDQCDSSSASAPSCGKVFTSSSGAQMPGDECEDDADCAPASSGRVECVSDFVGDATIRKCQTRLPGKAGSSPCVGTVDGDITFYSGVTEGIPPTGYLCDLADGLSCDGQTGACESLAAVGEPCGGAQCVQSAYCAFTEGVCVARVALGAACEDGQCVAGAYCQASDNTCAALRVDGADCEAAEECESYQCINQKCAIENDLSLAFLCGTN
jgi:hypothetical protein